MRSSSRIAHPTRIRAAAIALLLGSLALCAAAGVARKPLVIAPVIEGLLICDNFTANEYRKMIDGDSHCAANGGSGVKAAARMLDELEPGGPKGNVQVGYTVTVQLLSLYRMREGRWVIDEERVQRVLDVLNELKRPAVLYLAANHFDTPGAITSALEADPVNLMHLADGSVPRATYFGYKIVPYTLQTDEAIPVNRYRFAALRHIGARVAKLPKATQERIVAITLAGEVHHMFRDFENGMGAYDSVAVTDYSPASVTGFQRWLRARYQSVEQLNQASGGAFRSFDEVQPPSKNMISAQGDKTQHFDGFAGGKLPVAGWMWDPARKVAAIELRVDGKPLAQLERDFNRLDVYRAVEAVDDPSVGFRGDIDFSGWAPGEYSLQVVARTPGSDYELAQVTVEVVPGSPLVRTVASRNLANTAKLPGLGALADVKASLDLPRNRQQLMFNPLARDWNSYRAWQVNEFVTKFYKVARSAGLPADKLFSHQIVPRVNSSWNPEFFATDASVGAGFPWKQGFNTYGGAAGGPWTARFVAENRLADYGVPEFHPQQWKRPDAARKALAMHQKLGARFVSPYYLSVIANRNLKTGATLNRLEIRPNNTLDGSDQLFRAIKEFAAQ